MKKKIFYGFIVLFFILQFLPIDRSNPKVESDLIAPIQVKSILHRSCYDCHSNETRYPFYSYFFPASVFMAHHVEEGREELNFSNWETLSTHKKATKAKDIVEEIEEKEMPLTSYTLLHRDALLTPGDIEIIKKWAEEMERRDESGN